MHTVKTFNKIAGEGLKCLGENIRLAQSQDKDYDGIILRSYKLSMDDVAEHTKIIARAGAGYNNVPVDECTEKGIVVMNTPGANANAVKELVLCAFLLAARNVTKGANWVQTLSKDDDVAKLVESEKSNFKGRELYGKKVGVIGLGAIGVRVANALDELGMEVFGYDPYLSVDHAWNLNKNISRSYDIEKIFKRCDFVTIHVPLTDSTKDTVNKEVLTVAKEGIKIINLARGGLVNDEAIIEAVSNGTVGCYVTDFPNKNLIGIDNIICIPHLGASTPESETNCAKMAARQVKEYLQNGNIKNSVNLPNCDLGPKECVERLCIIHKNIPGMVGKFTSMLASNNINISNMINKSRNDIAYTMIDIDDHINDAALKALKNIEGIIKFRILKK